MASSDKGRSGEYSLGDEVHAMLRGVGPGVAKCPSRRDLGKMRAIELYREACSGGRESVCALARELGLDESTLRRRLKHGDIGSGLADILLLPADRFERAIAAMRAAARELRELDDSDNVGTGTTG